MSGRVVLVCGYNETVACLIVIVNSRNLRLYYTEEIKRPRTSGQSLRASESARERLLLLLIQRK